SEGVAVEAGRVFAGSAIGGSVGLPTLTPTPLPGGEGLEAGERLGQVGTGLDDGAEQLFQRGVHFGAQVVAGVVAHLQAGEAGGFRFAQGRVLGQLEPQARGQPAPGARARGRAALRLQGFEVLTGAAFAFGAVVPAVGAGCVAVLGRDAAERLAVGAGRTQPEAAVVPAGPRQPPGLPATRARPLLDAVGALGRVAAVVAHRAGVAEGVGVV